MDNYLVFGHLMGEVTFWSPKKAQEVHVLLRDPYLVVH